MKEKIIYHGLFHDFINYKALIKAQANNNLYLDKVKDYKYNCNHDSKPKVKRLKMYNKNNYYKNNS